LLAPTINSLLYREQQVTPVDLSTAGAFHLRFALATTEMFPFRQALE